MKREAFTPNICTQKTNNDIYKTDVVNISYVIESIIPINWKQIAARIDAVC